MRNKREAWRRGPGDEMSGAKCSSDLAAMSVLHTPNRPILTTLDTNGALVFTRWQEEILASFGSHSSFNLQANVVSQLLQAESLVLLVFHYLPAHAMMEEAEFFIYEVCQITYSGLSYIYRPIVKGCRGPVYPLSTWNESLLMVAADSIIQLGCQWNSKLFKSLVSTRYVERDQCLLCIKCKQTFFFIVLKAAWIRHGCVVEVVLVQNWLDPGGGREFVSVSLQSLYLQQ